MTAPRLTFDSVTVDFGTTRALNHVTSHFAPGEIVGLLGHNGAGKSTMLNVATGAVHATAGKIFIDGQAVDLSTPADAHAHGITVVHQSPALADNLSVIDNLYIGRATTGRSVAEREAARQALDEVGGSHLDLDTIVGVLSLGQRQIIDISRGLLIGNMKVLLLDEPTAALGQSETDALHALIRSVSTKGTTVVYVSHRLPDIVDVCERVVILSNGAIAAEMPVAGLSTRELARALAPGLEDEEFVPMSRGEIMVNIVKPHRMQFYCGEVVGLFGVASGDQFALLEALTGRGGNVDCQVDGRDYAPASPSAAIKAGVHPVAADRDKDGLVPTMSAIDNVYGPWRGRRIGGRLVAESRRGRARLYDQVRSELNIHGPGGSSPISAFSGGNRQKHLIAAWMRPVAPKVLLLAQPTQGVDVGAKADIRRAIRAATEAGTCVIVASAESDEIATMCDRSYVLSSGQCQEVARSPHFDSDLLQCLLDLIPKKKELAS
ncbi:ATP-binding cassette domain-containing protein [Demequina aurantiaca]|uniref:ATP-binding cassette domain-containing protein n=1 Tax=Demequina aurantiaca TaxID=676200 RepID=UPI003D3399F7